VRGHAAWALGRIGSPRARALLAGCLTGESDPWVRAEIAAALEPLPASSAL
jgi:epoxyqueuosine reductase